MLTRLFHRRHKALSWLIRPFHRLHGALLWVWTSHEPDDPQQNGSRHEPDGPQPNESTSHGSSDPQVDACDLCRHVRFHSSESDEEVAKLMHSPCSDCISFDDRDRHLCSICQHWRFRHFFNCVLPTSIHRIDIDCVPWGYELSKGCAFCDMVSHTSEITAKLHRRHTSKPTRLLQMKIYPGTQSRTIEYLGLIKINLVHLYHPADVPDCVQTKPRWSLVKDWLMECTREHDKCHSQYFKQPDEIRLIDVQRRRLVRANENCRFVALSYVWGSNRNSKRLTCVESNARSLERDGALKAEELPHTIEDAFRVCRNLGEKYLWVDRLCIVQDDSSQKHEQIEAMAKIFSSAFLVIVVLDGDMETGIPGIQPRLFEVQKQVEIADFVCMNQLPDFEELINHSDWARRGWTYQEAVLARRKLYFSWAQVFLQCNTDLKEECATRQQKRVKSGGSFLTEREWSFDVWQWHLRRYTARSLSYQSDIYNAIAGISNALLPGPASWLYGLPRRDFDEALLWFNDLRNGYRISDTDDVLFPRWSWSSVKGVPLHQTTIGDPEHDINIQHEDAYRNVFVGTVVAWNYQEEDCTPPRFVPVRDSNSVAYVRPRNDGCRLIYSEKDAWIRRDFHLAVDLGVVWNCIGSYNAYKASRRKSSLRLLCYGIAWSQGCIDRNWPFPGLAERTFQELGADLEKRWQEVDYLERDILLCTPQEQQTPGPYIEMPLDRSTLKGRAQTSLFALKETRRLIIIDNEGRPAGQIEDIEEKKAKVSLQCSASYMYQLIALSIGYFKWPGDIEQVHGQFLDDDPVAGHLWADVAKYNSEWGSPADEEAAISDLSKAVGPNGLDISYLDSEGRTVQFIPIVYVMLAEWDGPIARRISIGWVFLTRWVKSNPQFKTVYLA